MKIKGLVKIIEQIDDMLINTGNEMDDLNGDEDRYEKLDQVYMAMDSALEALKEIEEI